MSDSWADCTSVEQYEKHEVKQYRIAQKFDMENFDEFDERPAIHRSLPFQPFPC